MEKTLREKQKEEALVRMRKMHLMSDVVKAFEKDNIVYYSERQNSIFNAVLYWASNNDKYMKTIKEFERKHKALVYHMQLTHLECGNNLALFYVSNDEEEWQLDRENITNGKAFVYVSDENDMFCEFGYVGFRPSMGGIVRTW